MVDISGHHRSFRDEFGFEELSLPLLINCCGYQSFSTKDYSVSRNIGRRDYQILYLLKGNGHFFIDEKWITYSAGSLILYKPKEPQIYHYNWKDATEVFWIHFTGFDCDSILNDFSIKSGNIGESTQFKSIFQEIILELQLKKPCFEKIVSSNFIRLLANIHRIQLQNEKHQESSFDIDRLIIQLNQSYMNSWCIKDMADFCNMSEDYFAHMFKKVMGQTPIFFLTSLRMEKAKELLLLENNSISEVSYLLGYTDPLYFSRAFKKYTGFAPSSYIKQALRIFTPFATN